MYKRQVYTKALVTTNLAHPVLLSWHDMIRLGIIDNSFPRPSTLSVESLTPLDIISRFPKVFKDELNQEPMKSEQIYLHLKPNATPFRVPAARQIPLRFRDLAEAK